MTTTIHRGDFVQWMREREWLAQNGYIPKAHAVLCDPPYYLGSITKRFGGANAAPAQYGTDGVYQRASRGFMGQTWDGFEDVYHYQQWVTEWGRLMLSYVYPGAVLAAFGGTRTFHRLAAGLEDAGWIVFDCCMWVTSQGFPKGHRQERDFQIARHGGTLGMITNDAMLSMTLPERLAWLKLERKWRGWNVALSPAYEPIVLARAPWSGTYAGIAQQYGTGALNIEGGRIGVDSNDPNNRSAQPTYYDKASNDFLGAISSRRGTFDPNGRWPKNLILSCACATDDHDDPTCPVRMLGEQSGEVGGHSVGNKGISYAIENEIYSPFNYARKPFDYNDTGTAARMFYQAKAASWERSAGLHDRPAVTVNDGRQTPIDNPYQRGETKRRNSHPTCKPIKLDEYLATLLLPPPLDVPRRLINPFSGSGSEVIAAMLAGWDEVVGFEQSEEYADIAEARIAWWSQFKDYDTAKRAYDADQGEQQQREAEAAIGVRQLPLLAGVRDG